LKKRIPDVFNTLLQLLDDGRLTDAQGHTVDFRNTVIIMTSNVGTEHVRQQSLGLVRTHDRNAEEAARERVFEALRQAFRPEFLNRIDEIIVFHALTEQELMQIVDLLVREVDERLREQGLTLELTPAAKKLLVREGYNPAYGARPLRRTVQRLVETPLSRKPAARFVQTRRYHPRRCRSADRCVDLHATRDARSGGEEAGRAGERVNSCASCGALVGGIVNCFTVPLLYYGSSHKLNIPPITATTIVRRTR
jgi:hypothetical protein